MNAKIERIILMSSAFCMAALSLPVRAGSVSDASAGHTAAFCDRRISLAEALAPAFCTKDNKEKILDQCFVVIHSAALKGRECSWQGCDMVSVVGEPAKLNGSNFVEYGVSAKHNNAPYVRVDGGVLPKFPFERHYMTLREALDVRKKQCRDTNLPAGIEEELCKPKNDLIKLNPFIGCLRFHGLL